MDADDVCGFFDFLVSVDDGDDVDNVGVPVRSIFCMAIVLPIIFGDDVPLARAASCVDGDANILLFNKGHP